MIGIFSFRGRIRSAYIVSFMLLLISFVLIFYVQQRLTRVTAGIARSYSVVTGMESLKSEFSSLEAGAGGYLLTRNERFLVSYTSSVNKFPVIFSELKATMDGDRDQLSRLDILRRYVDTRLEVIAPPAQATTSAKRGEPDVRSAVIDSMRWYADRIKNAELETIKSSKGKQIALFNGSRIIFSASLGIVFAALLYSFITFSMENKARENADKRADRFRSDLESNQNELQERNNELKELKDLEKFTSTGRIARTIAHEVRNPLTNILLATEQLQEIESKTEEAKELLRLINRNATRINQLVSELLDATRFVNLRFETVDLNQLLEETLEMAKDRIELNRIKVEKSYDPELCPVSVDREKIKVAFLNVIVNAIEAMEQGRGLLILRTRRQADKCIVEVRDNGKGMDEEVLQKLFEPYFTNKPGGNGLGLTNTQNIILNHQGKIGVQSEAGAGSRFVITLDNAPSKS